MQAQSGRRRRWLTALLLAAACAAPASEPEDAAASAWHTSLLEQAAEAWRERDLQRLAHILEQPRAGASAAQEERFATFDALAAALRVETEGFLRRRLCVAPASEAALDGGREPPDLEHGETAVVRIELESALDEELRLMARAGNGSQSLVVADVDIEEVFADGSRAKLRVPWSQPLEHDVVLRRGEPFTLTVPALGAPGPEVHIRRVAYTGAIMLADLQRGGLSLPLRRLPLEPLELTSFPRGFRVVREKALATLRVAARAPSDYPSHLVTASWFLARDGSAADREAALGALIETLRGGPPRAEPAVLACLAMVARDAAPPGRDRDAWLRWWALR